MSARHVLLAGSAAVILMGVGLSMGQEPRPPESAEPQAPPERPVGEVMPPAPVPMGMDAERLAPPPPPSQQPVALEESRQQPGAQPEQSPGAPGQPDEQSPDAPLSQPAAEDEAVPPAPEPGSGPTESEGDSEAALTLMPLGDQGELQRSTRVAPTAPIGEFVRDAEAAYERGRLVAVSGGEAGVTASCFACHGVDGAGDGTGAFPRLTGQSAFYMYKQLMDYATDRRPNDVMSPIAAALTEAEMEDVSIYYAMVEAPYHPEPDFDPRLIQQGGALNAVGSANRQIQACVNCHGPSGVGVPPSFPRLAGQYAEYTQLQLELWQQDVRQNDALGVMREIARRMTPEDIRAVSAYFETVRPEHGR